MGCKKGIHGVGMLVADRWIEKVLDVKRVNNYSCLFVNNYSCFIVNIYSCFMFFLCLSN